MPLRAYLQAALYIALGLGGVALPGGLLLRAESTGGRALGAVLLGLCLGVTALLCWLFIPRLSAPYRGPTIPGRRRVAITFDDGPGGAYTAAILDTLRRHGARATFFCVGHRAAAQPALLRRMAAEGHSIGNHTQDHRKLTLLARAEIAQQIDGAQAAIAACGVPAPRYFRAPHGFQSPHLGALLRARGLRLVAWTRGVWDTDRPGAATIARRAAGSLRDGAILLLHDGGGDRAQTAAALEEILRCCRARGLEAVTLPELLESSA